MKNLIKLVCLLAVVVTLSTGCAVNRATATVDKSGNLDNLKSMHVVKLAKDERGINVLIADKLRTRGYLVTTGNNAPGSVDAMVTYADKWMWDITMYMLELTITVRDPKTEFPLAVGNSFHTSLTRKAPVEMVDEVVENILKEGKTR
ncbi:MAG: hypothetical protein JWQ33_906 [Ramlibacter sp.]|nr:hypothetical protein [Ramlibacter sp.]